MASFGESSHRLCEGLVPPLQLATHVMYDEEEVPNVKCIHVVEEEVSLSQLGMAIRVWVRVTHGVQTRRCGCAYNFVPVGCTRTRPAQRRVQARV
jgi:hypothetical protein